MAMVARARHSPRTSRNRAGNTAHCGFRASRERARPASTGRRDRRARNPPPRARTKNIVGWPMIRTSWTRPKLRMPITSSGISPTPRPAHQQRARKPARAPRLRAEKSQRALRNGRPASGACKKANPGGRRIAEDQVNVATAGLDVGRQVLGDGARRPVRRVTLEQVEGLVVEGLHPGANDRAPDIGVLVYPDPDLYAHRDGVAGTAGGRGKLGDPLAGLLEAAHGDPDSRPAFAVAGGAPQGGGRAPSYEDRHARGPQRLRLQANVLDLEVAALKGDAIACPECAHDPQRLVRPSAARSEVDAAGAELRRVFAPNADAEG